MLWGLQSCSTTVLSERMWHFRESRHALTPSTYFQGSGTPWSRPVPDGLFSNGRSSQHSISVKGRTDFLCQLIKRYLFSVSISAFCLLLEHGWMNVNWQTSGCWLCISLRNLRKTGTCQHTFNANDLCTKALPESWWFGIRITREVDRNDAVFVGNKHVTDTQLYIIVQNDVSGTLAAS